MSGGKTAGLYGGNVLKNKVTPKEMENHFIESGGSDGDYPIDNQGLAFFCRDFFNATSEEISEAIKFFNRL